MGLTPRRMADVALVDRSGAAIPGRGRKPDEIDELIVEIDNTHRIIEESVKTRLEPSPVLVGGAVIGIVVSQADTPVPGPADLIGTAIISAAIVLEITVVGPARQEAVIEARKKDIELIDRLAREYGLNRAERRELHDEMANVKGKGENLSEKEIRDLIETLFPDKK